MQDGGRERREAAEAAAEAARRRRRRRQWVVVAATVAGDPTGVSEAGAAVDQRRVRAILDRHGRRHERRPERRRSAVVPPLVQWPLGRSRRAALS